MWGYKKGIFGVSEIEQTMFGYQNHKDHKVRWIRNPNEELMTECAIKYSQKMTIRKVLNSLKRQP